MTPAEERAAARANWNARIVAGNDPGEEGRQELSPEEAWLAVGRLTRSLLELTGRIETRLPRNQWPSRLYRRGEAREDDGQLR